MDNINHPAHYTSGEIECIDAIREALGDNFIDYCRGNIIKYTWRCKNKGALVDDLKKARAYCTFAINHLEGKYD